MSKHLLSIFVIALIVSSIMLVNADDDVEQESNDEILDVPEASITKPPASVPRAMQNRPSFDYRVVSHRPMTCPPVPGAPHEPVFFCPTPRYGDEIEWKCVRLSDLCNRRVDCPDAEDEHPTFCMFFVLSNADMNSVKAVVSQIATKVLFGDPARNIAG